MKHKNDIIKSLKREIELRSSFFAARTKISTLYFGGGTPTVLSVGELEQLINKTKEVFDLDKLEELTVEANPDDLNPEYISGLRNIGVNRLSIGVQTLHESTLSWMNRSHHVNEAKNAVCEASKQGIKDISIDLIYGIPGLDNNLWGASLDEILSWPVNHLSAYSLSLEQGTPYSKLVQQKKYLPPDEDAAAGHFELLLQKLKQKNWEQYEVSNFCKASNYSQHNSAYWSGQPYLGIGPSAHSYDQVKRYWNIANNAAYIESLSHDYIPAESERLTLKERTNEYILTRLRTKWGLDTHLLQSIYGLNPEHFKIRADKFVKQGLLIQKDSQIYLSDQGYLYADLISAELFV